MQYFVFSLLIAFPIASGASLKLVAMGRVFFDELCKTKGTRQHARGFHNVFTSIQRVVHAGRLKMYFPLVDGLSAALIVLACLLISFYCYSTSFVGVFKAYSIPGPAPWPVLNHIPELRKHGLSKMLDTWKAQYGKTFGIYGMFPRCATLVTFDSKILEHILVKDFNNYTDRVAKNTTLCPVIDGLFFLNGDEWRRSRHVLSPMFTSGRLKHMLRHVSTSATLLVEFVKKMKRDDKLIPLKATASRYSSDVIARVSFSIDSKALTEDNSEFAYNIGNFIRIPVTWLQEICRNIGEVCPQVLQFGLKYFNQQVDVIQPETNRYFVTLINNAIEEKRTNGTSQSGLYDMLDMLLQAEVDNETGKNLKADDRKLTRKHVIGNSAILILAAFETTSTALTSILYLLARHPHIQDKLIAEVDDVMEGKTTPSYEDLSKLVYMTQVIYESLRMYPPSPDVTRRAKETRSYDGFTIPKGVTIFIPIYKIVKDPEYFPDPYTFDPERFSPMRKFDIDPVTFLPFGFGRRQCVAKRLAIMELKVVLCQLLACMKFIQTERTEPRFGHEAKYEHVDDFFVPTKPITLDIEFRNEHKA